MRRDRGDTLVARRGDDDVARGQRAAPHADALRIDAFDSACKGNGRGPVGELAMHGDQLARLTVAVAEIAVVEQQHIEAGGGEALCIGSQ